jgi:hypothetical protein
MPLLVLLLLPAAHMFDKTSVVMLCMMTIAFLIPCVISYVPWLRMLSTPPSLPPQRQQQQQYYSSTPYSDSQLYADAYSTPISSSGYGFGVQNAAAYGTAVPPRPAARVRGPGLAAAHSSSSGAGSGAS